MSYITELNNNIVGTCCLTFLRNLLFERGLRMLVEALIVNDNLRGQGIGGLMMKHIIKIAKSRNVKVIELSPNKQRSGAIDFYKNLGFEASHEGIKLYL